MMKSSSTGRRIEDPLRSIVRAITSITINGDSTTVPTIGGNATSSIEDIHPVRSATDVAAVFSSRPSPVKSAPKTLWSGRESGVG